MQLLLLPLLSPIITTITDCDTDNRNYTTCNNDETNNSASTSTSTPVSHDPINISTTSVNNISSTGLNNNLINSPSINSTTSSSLSKRSRSSSAKSDSYELTPEMKEEYKQAFDALDNNKKWVLDDGTKVEDAMYAYGENCIYEHPVHSFILDTRDKCWESVFTPSQLEQIDSGKKALCEYNESCKNMFSALSQVIIDANKRVPLASSSSSAGAETTTTTAIGDEKGKKSSYLKLAMKKEDLIGKLWKRLAEFGMIDPCQDYDLHWLQGTMNYFLDLYRFRVLDWVEKNGSEMDFVNRIWSLLDNVFDDMMVETRRDNGSVAATFIDNEQRAITGMAPIAAKVPSIRPDLVLFKNGVEYGVAECGKGDCGEIGKKEIVETGLHCPKLMKSMFLHTVSQCDNNENVARALRVVGFSQFGLRMKVLVMDNPDGYVCRIRSTSQYEISTNPSYMPSGLFPILKLTLKSKLTVQSSIKVVHDYLACEYNDDEPDVKCYRKESKTQLVLPRLRKSPNKKLKTSL